MVTTEGLAIALLAWAVTATLAVRFWRKAADQGRALERFQKILDVDAYVAQLHSTFEQHQRQRAHEIDAYVAQQRAAIEQHQRQRAQELEEQITGQRAGFERFQNDRKREIDEHVARQRAELDRLRDDVESRVAGKRALLDEILAEIAAAEPAQQAAAARAAELRAEIAQLEETQDLQSFGFYKARYALDTPEEYKNKLEECRAAQKDMVSEGTAVVCANQWTVQGSAAKGKKMVGEQIRLMLRAFNGESDAAIAKIKYNNAESLENRIKAAFKAINKLGATKGTTISDQYAALKLNELCLSHEYQEKLQEEREEQRRLREELKEAEKAEREIERAVEQAEGEEAKYALALAAAQDQVREATGKQLEKLEKLVSKLQSELGEAIDRKVKATARAQLVKSGHVYVLSNIGSFGEGVYKIGMTRRFEPLERVKELGDASVPFYFDVHAMIYCEDAPRLESALHREFASRRINRINMRREYFRVTLDEIRRAVAKHHGIVTFLLEPEAEEYRKTVAMAVPANDHAALQA